MNNLTRLKKMTMVVVLAGLGIVVGLIEIPWFPIPPLGAFLRLDFSDVVILVALVTIGFSGSFQVIILRTIVRRLIMGMGVTEWIGEISAVSASLLLMLSFFLISLLIKKDQDDLEKKYSLKEYLTTIFTVTVIQAVLMSILSTVFITPMFISFLMLEQFHVSMFGNFMNDLIEQTMFNSQEQYLWFSFIAFVPFNFVKGFIIANIFYFTKPLVLTLYEGNEKVN